MEEKSISLPPALRSNGDQDLISKLPDELIHQIFSFLDMVHVVPTCVLSKRWRYLWTSLPFLNFDCADFMERRGINPVCNRHQFIYLFIYFVERVLLLRSRSSHIHKFRLWCCRCYGSCPHIDIERWICLALLRNAKEIEVDADKYPMIDPNYDGFTSTALRTMKLCTQPSKLAIYSPPDSVCLPHLKKMHLYGLVFKDGESISSLISGCPLLERLYISCFLEETEKPVTISAPQLQHLEISLQPSLHRVIDPYQIMISAPKLLSLTCHDCAPNDYSFANVSSLVNAEIDVAPHPWKAPVYVNNITSCLRGLAHVKCLALCLPLTLHEAIFPPAGIEGMLPSFQNLNMLKLRIHASMDEVRAATCLLKICPSLETLVFELFDGNYDGLQTETADLFAHCVLPHLKHVEIHNVVGREAECKLIQYLLKNAKGLEMMILLPKKVYHS